MRNARTVMTGYRRYILNQKRIWNTNQVSQGRAFNRRAVRSMIKYLLWIQAYLAAKRCVVAGIEMVDA